MNFWKPVQAEEVVKHFAPKVYKHLKRIFGPHADVDDVYQAVFVEILRSLPAFKGQARLSTYIRRITWNVAYQEMRHRYRHQRLSFLGDAEPDDVDCVDAEQRTDNHRHMQAIYSALALLEPKQRVVVLMHDIEERTLKEISETLGRAPTTVASQLYAGRQCIAKIVHHNVQKQAPDNAHTNANSKRGSS